MLQPGRAVPKNPEKHDSFFNSVAAVSRQWNRILDFLGGPREAWGRLTAGAALRAAATLRATGAVLRTAERASRALLSRASSGGARFARPR